VRKATLDAWQSVRTLAQNQHRPANSKTVQEFAREEGIGRYAAERILKEAVALGAATVHRVPGRGGMITVYVPKNK